MCVRLRPRCRCVEERIACTMPTTAARARFYCCSSAYVSPACTDVLAALSHCAGAVIRATRRTAAVPVRRHAPTSLRSVSVVRACCTDDGGDSHLKRSNQALKIPARLSFRACAYRSVENDDRFCCVQRGPYFGCERARGCGLHSAQCNACCGRTPWLTAAALRCRHALCSKCLRTRQGQFCGIGGGGGGFVGPGGGGSSDFSPYGPGR